MSASAAASVASYETIDVRPLGACLGAEIEGLDLRRPLGEAQQRDLRAALTAHLVVFLRGPMLTNEEHIGAASQLGTPNVYLVTRARGIEEPLEFIEDSEQSPPKTDLWHTDVAFIEEPPELAMIQMLEAPAAGGDTMWCSLYAAHDRLSPRLQAFVADLEQDLHPGRVFRETIELQFGRAVYEKVAHELEGARHPLVRVHPATGRRALFLCGDYVRGLVGLEPAESDLLYGYLRTLLHDPNLQCRWSWRVGDVAIWDERCTNHRALSDHFPARRRIRRCTIGASRPLGPRAARAAGIQVAPLPGPAEARADSRAGGAGRA